METKTQNRIVRPLTEGWKFFLGDPEGAQTAAFNDAQWRGVCVPHDWSVEASFDERLEGATGYLPGGIGWYRKTFEPLNTETTYLHFDGVYNNATIYLNGVRIGERPYGYAPFYLDISEHVQDGENVIAVRVDHSRYCDSRWYTGSGIYREVELVGAARTHIPVWGIFVTTPEVSAEAATVEVQVEVCQPRDDVSVVTEIVNPAGEVVAEVTTAAAELVTQSVAVAQPQLWSGEAPHLYHAVTTLRCGSEIVDTYTTRFGIRSVRFDAQKGFFLNDVNMKIKGVCLHHDGGCVGAAVPDDVWRRRFETLKSCGVNAIRIAHNPGSVAFLRLCDEIGFLVQDEFFDEWDNPKDKRLNQNETHDDYISRGYTEHFQEWAERDLKDVMRSHRNHPCIFQWSIGNEIEWTYPRNSEATGFFDASWSGNYFWEQPPHAIDEIKRLLQELPRGQYDIGETAQKLSKWTKELDTSRPVIANCILPSSSYLSGYADALDIIGFSYRRVIYDYGHKHYPDLPLMGTENLGQWHEWKAIEERPFVSGTFLWTGIDYMGEVHGQWPKKSLNSGLLDTAGFEKGSFHLFKSLWVDTPHVHLVTQTLEKSPYVHDAATGYIGEENRDAWQQKTWLWHDVNTHWNYDDGEMIAVEVYTNCEQVELFLNGASLGVKRLADFDDHIVKWAVPYAAGTLEAKAVGADAALSTAGEVAGVELEVDGCHVIAQLVDAAGVPVKTDEREIVFELKSEGRILGVDNGDPKNVQDFQSDRIVTSQGRCLMVASSADNLQVVVQCEGLTCVEVREEALV